nr:MAG TPA: hypothetical protein [Caudoviricetes sp.]
MISLCNILKNISRLHIDITDNTQYNQNIFGDITMNEKR